MTTDDQSPAPDAGPIDKPSQDSPVAAEQSKRSPEESNPQPKKSPQEATPAPRGERQAPKEPEAKAPDQSGGDRPDPKPAREPKGDSEPAESQDAKSGKGGSRRRRSRGSSGPKPPKESGSHDHDSEKVAKYAWKIYLAEITEEGVTMVDDRTAKELARRCFELAVTFLDEQAKQSQ